MTARTLSVAPIRRSFVVRVPQLRAYEIFTGRMVDWVPAEHSLLEAARAQVTIEPRVGGRWFESGQDGARCDWGFVRNWEPPFRVVLVWQLSSEWQFDPSLETEIEVTFGAEGDDCTRIDFEHRGLEAYGENAELMREKLDAPTAWDHWHEGLQALIG